MLEAMLTVGNQVVVMFIMLAIGYFCSKRKMITARGASQLTSVLLNFAVPALIISSMQQGADSIGIGNILMMFLLTLVAHALCIGVSYLLFRHEEERRRKVLRYGMIYSNAGFMGLPLVSGVLGAEAVGYASAYIVCATVVTWTHGYTLMSGARDHLLRKLILNPGILAFLAGMVLYLFSVHLPPVLSSLCDGIGALNTPLSMIVVGNYIARLKWKEMFADKNIYLASLFRLALLPIAFLGLAFLFRPEPMVLTVCLTLTAAPTAAGTVLFATQFGQDAKTGAKLVGMSTIFSIVTMPLIVVLCESLTGMI